MTTYRMPNLTAAEIRKIGNQAVADVVSKKITTSSKSETLVTPKTSRLTRNVAQGNMIVSKPINKNSLTQKAIEGTTISPAQGRGYFNEAFNKARKG